jgi:hypothetical protein
MRSACQMSWPLLARSMLNNQTRSPQKSPQQRVVRNHVSQHDEKASPELGVQSSEGTQMRRKRRPMKSSHEPWHAYDRRRVAVGLMSTLQHAEGMSGSQQKAG